MQKGQEEKQSEKSQLLNTRSKSLVPGESCWEDEKSINDTSESSGNEVDSEQIV